VFRDLLARWNSAIVAVLPIGVAAGLDLLGEPPARLHPVVWYGKVIRYMERFVPRKPHAQLWYGLGMLLMASPVAFVPALLIQQVERRVARCSSQQEHGFPSVLLSVLFSGVALKPLFALGMLVKAGRLVREALEDEDIVVAREALRNLVSRDREQLDRELVAAAAIESLAENLSDSVVAPLFYYALFGLPGASLYRLYNTFDAMIGYHGDYEYSGKAAARLDDLLNLLPSRFTAILIVLCAPLFGGDRYQAWRIWRRDASRTESPNAGQPMAAAAGALRLQLTKVDHYTLGDDERGTSPADIKRAERMVCWVGGLALLLTAFVRFFRSEHA
jgi:adenosylcobinamide-phosphate synthase